MSVELAWMLGAFGAGWVLVRVGIPAMVGYLAAGAVLGALGAESTALLDGIAHAGVLLLLFGVGLHLRLRNLLDRAVLAGASAQLAISTTLFAAATIPLGLPIGSALFLGLILSFSSTVLAAKDMEQREEMGAYYGRVAIGILLIQDLAALALILTGGAGAPSTWALALPGLFLLRPALLWLVAHTHDDSLILLLAALLALGTAQVFAQCGLPDEIGALAIGAMLADHPRANELQHRLWGLKEFFLVGFFFQVGLLALPDPAALRPALGWVLLLIALLPFKAALFFGLLTALGLRARSAFLAGSVLTSYSEFTLLAGLIGVDNGLITPTMFSVITLVTAASFAVNLPTNRLINAVYERLEPWLLRAQRVGSHPDRALRSLGAARYVVVGMGRTGAAAYDFLHQQGGRPVGIDSDPVVIQRQLAAGRRVVYGDALDPELWDGLKLSGLVGAVVVVPNLNARLRSAQRLKHHRPDLRVSTYALHQRELAPLTRAGADDVHHILADAGVRLAETLPGIQDP